MAGQKTSPLPAVKPTPQSNKSMPASTKLDTQWQAQLFNPAPGPTGGVAQLSNDFRVAGSQPVVFVNPEQVKAPLDLQTWLNRISGRSK